MSSEFIVREELPEDQAAIREVNDLAFGSTAEGKLVDRLRADGLVVASVVAVTNETVIGHALYSELPIEIAAGTIRCAALAPVAVLPAWQGRGVGSAIIRAGLDLCRERDCAAVIVLGHPDYYPRFGFSAELAATLESPYRGPAFMALEFRQGSLAGGGVVHYPPAFSLVD